MIKDKKPRFELGTVDDLFTTQEMRDDAKLKRIYEIPVDDIDEFPNHPYQVSETQSIF